MSLRPGHAVLEPLDQERVEPLKEVQWPRGDEKEEAREERVEREK